MIRRDNRHAIEGAHLYVHRRNIDLPALPETVTHYCIDNISRGGLRFHCQDHYRIDERIEITVKLANGESHTAMGRICYRSSHHGSGDRFHYGVSFLNNFQAMALCR